jgi:hypothetical protein
MCIEDYPDETFNETTKYPYREAVGSLMYLALCTRPDISYAVNYASEFNDKFTKIHVTAVKRIFRYLRGTTSYGLMYESTGDINLTGYSDADYAGDKLTRKSRTGTLLQIGNSTISWCSQKQSIVAQSTTEAEYVAASQSIKDLLWLNLLKNELLNEIGDVPRLMVDNQSAIKLIKNSQFHKRSKHIDIKYHFIRDHYEKGHFIVGYVNSKDQKADVLTKGLAKDGFEFQRKLLGVEDNTLESSKVGVLKKDCSDSNATSVAEL